MVITGMLLYVVMTERWRWPVPAAAAVMAVFLTIDLAFFGANGLKIPQGGWVTLSIAMLLFTLMTTWKTGRRLVAERLTARAMPLDDFIDMISKVKPARVPGTVGLHDGSARRHAAGAGAQRPLQQGAPQSRRRAHGEHRAAAACAG